MLYSSYHKHLKAEKRKRDFKALEKLKTDDPALWKEKAEEIERARIEVLLTLSSSPVAVLCRIASW